MIPDDFKQRVREATDIVELVSRYVTLKPAGRTWKGLCPFHTEKTPSFNVNPALQIFKCFGCGAAGDVFAFLMRMEGVSFPEALRDLAGRAGLRVPAAEASESSARDDQRRRLLNVMAWAAERFAQGLQHPEAGRPAREYLERRGVAPELARRFGLGYAPPGWDLLLKAAQRDGYSETLLAAAGLVVPRREGGGHYDRFRGRLLFPIRDPQGRTLAFGGRILDDARDEPKYINSPETDIYRKGETLFGLDLAREAARKTGRLLLVEGYLDALACHAAGLEHTAAVLGTALTPQQAGLVRRTVQALVLVYDADAAGVQALLRAVESVKRQNLELALSVAVLPGAKDPDEFRRLRGDRALADHLQQTRPWMDYVLEHFLAREQIQGWEGKAAVLRQVAPFLAVMNESLAEQRLERGEYLRRLAERLRLDEQDVRTFLAARLREAERAPGSPVSEASGERNPQRPAGSQAESMLVATLLKYPFLIEGATEKLDPELLSDPDLRELARRLLSAPAPDPDAEDAWRDALFNALSGTPLMERVGALLAETGDFEVPERVVQDCLNRLEASRLRAEIERIQGRLAESLARGDREAGRQLQTSELELKNRLKHLGVDWRTRGPSRPPR